MEVKMELLSEALYRKLLDPAAFLPTAEID